MRNIRYITAIIMPFLAIGPAYAWGPDGHSIVAEIAQRRLNGNAIASIEYLLDGEKSLASISGWADQFQMAGPNSRGWHYVNIPYEADAYISDRDCKPLPEGCVVEAISRFQAMLEDANASKEERLRALRFLVHFVGDVHQPLHAVNRNDAGGSRVQVTFSGTSTSLHSVWDGELLDHRSTYWGSHVDLLEQGWLREHDATQWNGGTPSDWATQAHEIAVEIAYDIPGDGVLGDDYYRRAQPYVDQQLALAGIRLARLLNEIWPEKP